jgi:hypothetical protein
MMNWRPYTLLFVLGLAVALGIASLQQLPGYLDSDYYFVGGLQLVEGKGFTEPFLWNYLDDPAGIPHPSHTYWLPLSSILAATSMFVTGQHTYVAARLIFILITALVPLLTVYLAFDITGRRDLSVTSGMLAVFSVFHVPFMPVTDNFAPFMLLGGLIFILTKQERWWAIVLMGILAGLMNLARSDGLLWLGLVGLLSLWRSLEVNQSIKSRFRSFMFFGVLVLIGYSLVMGPWYARNIAIFGSPMAPGGSRILWLTNYNDTFAYPADQVSMSAWLETGWGAALKVRLWAFGMNLMNAFGAQGGILLFPFILIGFWQVRQDIRARLALTGWLILFAVMTVLFPFAGARGGFFHAGTAFQPFWWAVAPLGLERIVTGIRHRNLLDERAYAIFRGALVVICVGLTGLIIWIRILQSGWQLEEELYVGVERLLIEQGARPDEIAIVRNPPGYYIVSGRSTIVMPPGGPKTILALAERYGASYFVLEPGGVLEEYREIYERYEANPGLEYLGEVDDARIYALHPAE